MKWSDHQDSMNWHIAKVKCASSQRHIPTRAEMDQNRNKPYKFDLDIHVEQVSEMEPLYSTINQCIFS